MNGITHKQAQKYVRLDLDGLLTDNQRRDLETHLSGCEACRIEAQAFSTLTSRLQSGFRSRWDAQDGPSKNVMANVRSQTRRIIMSNRISLGIKALAGVVALFVFGFLINTVVSQMRDHSVAASATQTNTAVSPDRRLLAFTSAVENGNLDIYTMYPDGSGLTNLTHNPAHDINPYWSPDGKRIAFMSDRNGFMDLFVMDADGSNLTQVTNNSQPTANAHHEFGVSDYGPWSPDGSRLLYTEWSPDTETWKLCVIGVDGGNKTPLAEVPNIYTSPSWSPDGKHVAFVRTKPQNDPQEHEANHIYVVDMNGNNLTDATALIPPDENLFAFEYSWSSDGQSIFFIAERYSYENGNGKSTFYQASLDGSSLVEIDHVSTHMADWWNGTSLIQSFGTNILTWLRPDGTHNAFNPYKDCKKPYIEYGYNSQRSSGGDLIISARCDDDEWFYWTNPDGTVIRQLLNYPIRAKQNSVSLYWSPDDRYIAINLISSDITSLYVLNVADALNDPSMQPIKVDIAGGAQYYNVSWQPLP